MNNIAYKRFNFKFRELIWPVLFILGLYIIVPQLSSFRSSLHLLTSPNVYWVTLASLAIAATYLSAAATYCLLAIKPISYLQEVLIQLATMFVNRLLPAGIGGLGANYEYLRHKRHKASQAVSIVATNNLMGVIGHIVIVLITLSLVRRSNLLPGHISYKATADLEIAAGLIIIGLITGLYYLRNKLKKFLKDFYKQILTYEHHLTKTGLALLSQMALTLFNVLCLSFSARAIGIDLSFVVILLIFTFGSGVRNVTPTPGGLGGFEAGLTAGFVAYHLPAAQALAAVLLYRLISYWVPIVIGMISFIWAEKAGLFNF